MITLRVQNNYNERFAPAGAKKAYIARITGRDPKMTFAREFHGKEVMVDEPGLYELRNTDKKGRPDDEYCIIYPDVDGSLVEESVDKEFAMKLAKLLDSRSIESCLDSNGEIVTAKQAEKAVVARTIDDVTNACWTLIQTLPEKEAKKVLAALKARVSPKQIAQSPLSPETPCGIVTQVGMDSTPAIAGTVGMDEPETLRETYNRVVDLIVPGHAANG